MFQAFMIVLREGVEAFLIVAVIITFLRKTSQIHLVRMALLSIAVSFLISGLLGYFLWQTEGVHQPLIEGILGAVTVVLVSTLIFHMWKIGPTLKSEMESRLSEMASNSNLKASAWGVFWFTLVMITREGMETALLLFQVRDSQIVLGASLGILGAGLICYLCQQFGYKIRLKHFFRVTAVFLLLFTFQIAVQSFHEFTEAGIIPNSDFLHRASEPYSTEGIYGKWFSWITFIGFALWLAYYWVVDKSQSLKTNS